mmetsp:Transcript_16868/g.46113  ORF Transcript_16868/g.46113 Transcript_16868/m.46113 type:complete len:246 (-) Transcript_16868:307-1044(-)
MGQGSVPSDRPNLQTPDGVVGEDRGASKGAEQPGLNSAALKGSAGAKPEDSQASRPNADAAAADKVSDAGDDAATRRSGGGSEGGNLVKVRSEATSSGPTSAVSSFGGSVTVSAAAAPIVGAPAAGSVLSASAAGTSKDSVSQLSSGTTKISATSDKPSISSDKAVAVFSSAISSLAAPITAQRASDAGVSGQGNTSSVNLAMAPEMVSVNIYELERLRMENEEMREELAYLRRQNDLLWAMHML